jgi:hypothetical protein
MAIFILEPGCIPFSIVCCPRQLSGGSKFFFHGICRKHDIPIAIGTDEADEGMPEPGIARFYCNNSIEQ